MKIKIVSKNHNPFLKRDEYDIELEHFGEATPAKAHMQQTVAKEVDKHAQHVEIVNIFSHYGDAKSKMRAYVWDEKNVDDLSKVKKEKTEAPAEKKEE